MTLAIGCDVPPVDEPDPTTSGTTTSATTEDPPTPDPSTTEAPPVQDGSSSDGGTTGTTSSNDDNGDGPPPVVLDVGVPDDGGDCPLISVESEPMAVPSDIIIAVDTSGSMYEEAQAVQDNLNLFSQQIVDAGVDARVVLIASAPGAFDGICIDPPLGGGGCPAADDNEPLFLHVDSSVGSTNAYNQILNTYPQYEGVLRTEAVKQLLIVSDDNSWMTSGQFDSDFLALDLSHIGYTQHGIVCLSQCPPAASVGTQYINLANQTGGTIGDLCLQDFQPVFDELAAAVIDNSVPCTYDLPNAGGGPQDPSTAEVTVDFGRGEEVIPSVNGLDDCSDEQDSWFFDDPLDPSQIVFCPATCLKLKQAKEASVAISISCGAG